MGEIFAEIAALLFEVRIALWAAAAVAVLLAGGLMWWLL